MTSPRVVIVTGANRGIGQAICKLILSKPGISPITLYATSRKGIDLGFKHGEDQQLCYPSLDIANQSSVTAFANDIKKAGKPVDVLINNAGVNLDNSFSHDNARTTMDTNYRGTLAMCQAFIPLLSKSGRIVNLSSVGSSLKPYSDEMRARFRSITSLDELEELVQEYEAAVKDGTDAEKGFPVTRSYSVSKACVNSFTSILAKQNSGLAINCCCPGWIDTDMGGLVSARGTRPPKTAEDGAKIPVRLAFEDLGGVTGRYWANDSVRSKDDGQVQEW